MIRCAPIKLDEFQFLNADGVPNKIQLLRTGTFFHNDEKIVITKSDLKSMSENHEKKIRGIDLMLDYSHDSQKDAAAWFKSVTIENDGNELWAEVEWTPKGKESVKNKEFRYVSADFSKYYQDNETLKKYGPTLFGAGLTNRPVVKGMAPTILSEGKTEMDLQKENDELKSKVEKLMSELAEAKKTSKFSEKETELKAREDAIKLSEEKIALAEKENAEKIALAEKKAKFDTMLSENKVVEAQRKPFMSDDFEEFAKNAGVLNLSEKGTEQSKESEKHKGSDTPAQDEVIELAEKKIKEDSSLSFGQAQSIVLSENAELNKKYLKEVEV